MTIVKFDNVTKTYKTGEHEQKALDNVSFTLDEGKFVVILGPSGAGKSTLLNLLGGLDSPSAGTITVNGKDISKLIDNELADYRAETVGFVFQFYNLIPTLTVYENVELVSEISKNSLDAKKMIEEVGLSDHLHNFPSELSGGFLAIAVLTMVTTMHRIAAKEKLQIGTLKALDFKNRRILRHYTSYGLFIGIVGTALGTVLGFVVCGAIMSEDGMMGTYFDMPDWTSVIPVFCYPVMAGTIIFLTLISFLSVHKQLKGTAADTLRPYTPKKMRKTLFERTKIWDKLHFGTKWNIRDLSRHKSRSAMTLFGIVGCMILMVGGLGMRDTMAGFLELLDKDISNYSVKVNLVDNADTVKAKSLADELKGDWESLSGISLDGETVSLDIIHNPNALMNVIDENNARIALSDEGVYCL